MIVEGAVQIVHDAITALDKRGINLSDSDKEDIVNKLMVITCAE